MSDTGHLPCAGAAFCGAFCPTYRTEPELLAWCTAYASIMNAILYGLLQVGLNHFADRTPAEFASQQLGLDTNLKAVPRPRRTAQQPASYANATALPTRVDWVVYGAVTPVKNQLLVCSLGGALCACQHICCPGCIDLHVGRCRLREHR